MAYRLQILFQDGAVEALYKAKGHAGDAGIDVYCTKDAVIPANSQSTRLEFGIRCRMVGDQGSESFYLVPRSSISKTPLRMSNSIGVIDAGYRGQIMACVDNVGPDPYTISQGDRLFQIVHPSLKPIVGIEAVDHLDETSRGEGGFGSTGR